MLWGVRQLFRFSLGATHLLSQDPVRTQSVILRAKDLVCLIGQMYVAIPSNLDLFFFAYLAFIMKLTIRFVGTVPAKKNFG